MLPHCLLADAVCCMFQGDRGTHPTLPLAKVWQLLAAWWSPLQDRGVTGAEGYRLASVPRHNHGAVAVAHAGQQLDQQLDQASAWHQDTPPDPHPAEESVPAGKSLAAAVETMVSATETTPLHLLEPRQHAFQAEGWRLAVVQDTGQRQQALCHAV